MLLLNIKDKSISFSGDNKDTNFHGAWQHGKSNSLFELRKPVEQKCTWNGL